MQLSRSVATENDFLFEQLLAKKEQIEATFGDDLSWDRLENRKSCYIRYAALFDGYNRDNWPEMIKWLVDHIVRLEKAFKDPLLSANNKLKQVSGFTENKLEG